MDTGKGPLNRCRVEGCTRSPESGQEECAVHLGQGLSAGRLCEAKGCKKEAHAKGLCFTHYQADRRRQMGEAEGNHIHPTPRPHQLSCRVSDRTLKVLEKLGNKGRVGSDVIEKWASEQADAD